MKSLQKKSHKSVTDKAGEESGSVGYVVRSVLIYSAIALVIGIIAGYFWWAGIMLFVLFILYSLLELLLNGFIVGLVVLTLYVALKYAQKMGFKLKNFDRAKAKFMKVAGLPSALFVVNIILILVLISLGYFAVIR
ncbi:MAG: hypothetical protein WBD27_09420 [Pyrinomonadaceae bacterium]